MVVYSHMEVYNFLDFALFVIIFFRLHKVLKKGVGPYLPFLILVLGLPDALLLNLGIFIFKSQERNEFLENINAN